MDVGDFFYRAYRVKVNPGEAVTWRLLDGSATHDHRRSAAPPRRSTPASKAPGETYSFTFTAPGRYRYFCLIHPGLMDGVVQVGADTTDPR